jgi:hypothetical protein
METGMAPVPLPKETDARTIILFPAGTTRSQAIATLGTLIAHIWETDSVQGQPISPISSWSNFAWSADEKIAKPDQDRKMVSAFYGAVKAMLGM